MDFLTHPRWTEIDALFDQALERPPAERTAWLRVTCGDDPDLYHAVDALLRHDTEAEGAVGESATNYAHALIEAHVTEVASPLARGDRLGPYRVEEEIGRGGMGVVYRAVRDDGTYAREVAIKVVKRGMDTDAVLARFRHERRVLATLDHPAIARILDAGASPDGRPWLAMEFVEGEPINAAAKHQSLSLEARLSLFEQACEAVAHAHRRLVVHRDLKPANLLVTTAPDGRLATEEEGGAPDTSRTGQVKLLDFGIARLLDADDGDALTRAGERVLTPEYAAPEQRDGAPPTAAMDVYALGVMLYELLAGTRPEPDPSPPSAVASEDAAAAMGLAPDALRRRLRGDLDTLVLTALHPDPERRYRSADAVLEDLRRWRESLPLLARPDSARYRLARFVARRRTAVTAAAIGLIVLASGAAWTTWRIAEERDVARAERDRAEATAAFVTDLFNAADPFAAPTSRADTLRARDLLDRGAARARSTLADDAATRASVLTTIGNAQIGLGLYSAADSLLAEAVTAAEVSGDPVVTVEALLARGRALYNGERAADALEPLRQALTLAEAEVPARLPVAQFHLGSALRRTADFDAAVPLLVQASGARGTDSLFRASVLVERGRVEQDRGRSADAEPFYREALALQRQRLGAEHPDVAATLEMVGTSLLEQDRLDDAAPVLSDVLAIRQDVLGDTHPQTASARFNLAALARNRERYDEALVVFREVLAFDRAALGPDHPYVAGAWLELGITHARASRPDSAIAAYRNALDVIRRTQTDAHVIAQEAMGGIGQELTETGRAREAEPLLRRVLAIRRESLGADSWRTGISESGLGANLWRQGRLVEAERHLVAGYEAIRAANGPETGALRRLVEFYDATGRAAQAEPYRARLAEVAG
ncbi:MAG: serine/threonine-protein kinase [Bacteroidota bacterium]